MSEKSASSATIEQGLVIRNTGSWYQVHTDGGDLVECKIKGSFRLKDIKSTNPVAIGDRVTIVRNTEGTAFITDIADRRNYIVRKASNLSKQLHILAANLDQCFLLVTINYPLTTTVFIDRFLASAEAYRVPVRLIFNKIDRLDADEVARMKQLIEIYQQIGYSCSQISARLNEGVDVLRAAMSERTTLLAGHSGVGKSTLLNRLVPAAKARTAEISDAHRTGIHTTTFSEMYALPTETGGGYLIDTPGIKGFGTFDMGTGEVSHYFPEIFTASAECRFYNCTHRHEPCCAVMRAVENGQISASRYASYLNILEDQEAGKYRAPY
ncbi:MAG: ribosome small subunit-dependent GTPase A [Prevotellaceae bacterium]|jgi:ribosome biogenesis GTPase|nr:ribosome small subunit-dependent GTPase A [Prevotellaceae bacterium]